MVSIVVYNPTPANMKRMQKSIRRKYPEFYSSDDIFEPKCPPVNLSITDLDAKGHIVNPKAPCVVTTVDPKYTEDANRQGYFRKFNMKSDILTLREITRRKFLLYVTQHRAIEKARDQKYQSMIYQQTKNVLCMGSKQLCAIEEESFGALLAENERFQGLQVVNLSDEMRNFILVHQKLLMEVKDIHKRFIFLLKLIGYFHISEGAINILKFTDAGDFIFLKNDLVPDNISHHQIIQLKAFLADVVGPYLSLQTYLNADLWIAGYENTRHKFFEYYQQFTKLAILNHIVSIIHKKSLKSHYSKIAKHRVCTTLGYIKERKIHLQTEANRVLKHFEKKQLRSNIRWQIEGIAPVLFNKIQGMNSQAQKGNQTSAIVQLELIHTILMSHLNHLDRSQPDLYKHIEKEVRRCVAREQKASRKVLMKVNRFQNWIKHYKKH